MKVEARSPCWICGSELNKTFRPSTILRQIDSRSVKITDSDYGQTAALSICQNCRFVFADPLPHSNIIDLYRTMQDPEYLASSDARRMQMSNILNVSSRYHPTARSLLDVGAGIGLLLDAAKKRNIEADGVEPSRWCVETAARTNDHCLYCGTIDECIGKLRRYDLITLVDVIEHTDKPIHLLQQTRKLLNSGGLLVVVTIDIESIIARMLGRRWWHYRIAHVGYYSRRSMQYALNKCGYEIIATHYGGWRFPLHYIATRANKYIRVRFLEKIIKFMRRYRTLSGLVLPLNLGDSLIYIVKPKDSI